MTCSIDHSKFLRARTGGKVRLLKTLDTIDWVTIMMLEGSRKLNDVIIS